METMPQPAAQRAYDDYEPPFEWTKEQGSETLVIYLPGFRKDQLRVQVTSSGNLRVSGERHIGENKWRRFSNEFPIPLNCDVSGITAKFENGILYVKHPEKTATHVETQDKKEKPKSSTESAKPTLKPQEQQQQAAAAARDVASKASKDKQPNGEGAVREAKAKTEKEPSETSKGKSSTEDGLAEPEKEDKPKSFIPEKHESLGGAVKDGGKEDRGAAQCVGASVSGRPRPAEKQDVGIGGWLTTVKRNRKSLSWVVSVLLVLILSLYLRKAVIKTPEGSTGQEL